MVDTQQMCRCKEATWIIINWNKQGVIATVPFYFSIHITKQNHYSSDIGFLSQKRKGFLQCALLSVTTMLIRET